MHPAQYRKERQQLVSAIRKLVKPQCWNSGYGGRNGTPLKVWFPTDAKGRILDNKCFKLRGGFVLQEFIGLTEHGVALDGYAGGLSTAEFSSFPIEDLFLLHRWVLKRFA